MNIPSLVIGLAAGLFIGILACILYRNKKAKDDKEKIANAEEEALRIINDAIKSAESKKREATLEAKEEILRSRKEYEKEEKERRADLQKQERRLQQKEENIDRKTDAIEKKEEALAQKHAALDKENEEIKIIKRSQTEMLERISGFTADEAKKYLIEQVRGHPRDRPQDQGDRGPRQGRSGPVCPRDRSVRHPALRRRSRRRDHRQRGSPAQ